MRFGAGSSGAGDAARFIGEGGRGRLGGGIEWWADGVVGNWSSREFAAGGAATTILVTPFDASPKRPSFLSTSTSDSGARGTAAGGFVGGVCAMLVAGPCVGDIVKGGSDGGGSIDAPASD